MRTPENSVRHLAGRTTEPDVLLARFVRTEAIADLDRALASLWQLEELRALSVRLHAEAVAGTVPEVLVPLVEQLAERSEPLMGLLMAAEEVLLELERAAAYPTTELAGGRS